MSAREHRGACGLVAKLLLSLKWRHNGLGLLQAYVHEGATDELRVHVWHSSLRRTGIEKSGLLHDHRFDLTSSVLVGAVRQVEYEPISTPFGNWQLHSVVPARKALAASGTCDGLVSELPERYSINTSSVIVSAGESYFFPKFAFHGTHTESELVVTLVAKSAQEEAQARILAPWGEPVVHAFTDPLPESSWAPVLAEAETALLAAWAVR